MNTKHAFRTLLAGIILLGSVSAFSQVDKSVESSIKDITVFLARAQVTREIKTRIDVGKINLVIPGLAAQLDPNSIQVAGKGSFVILGTTHRQNFLQDMNMPKSLTFSKTRWSIISGHLLSNRVKRKSSIKRRLCSPPINGSAVGMPTSPWPN